jgi:adenylylsulfate kinase-like enzyme/2'-5' RNA ligase
MAQPPGLLLWFTGVPGAGKSFVARSLAASLRALSLPVTLLDGDAVRPLLDPRHGYDGPGRAAFYATLTNLALHLADQGHLVLVAATAHLRAFRDEARRRAPERFLEIFVDAPPDLARLQDARRAAHVYGSSIKNVPGQDIAYEPPLQPELVLHPGNRAQALPLLLSLVSPRLAPLEGAMKTVIQGLYLSLALPEGVLVPEQRALCARWGLAPRPELHATVLYLGEVELRQALALHAVLARWGRWSELRLRGTGVGAAEEQEPPCLLDAGAMEAPSPLARVAWWSVEGGEPLRALRAAALEACASVGIPVEQAGEDYFPHLTLGSWRPEGDPFWDQHVLPKRPSIAPSGPPEIPLWCAHLTSSRLHPASLLPLFFFR